MKQTNNISFLILFLSIIVHAQNVIRVPTDYSTIQSAIEHSRDYDSIIVDKGVFYEQIIISRPLTILGKGQLETIIRPQTVFGLPMLIKSSNVIVKNLWITASHNEYGISISNSENCTVINCKVDSTRTPLSLHYGIDAKAINIDSC
ncbi:MAG: hypothetical protein Q8L04_18015, partial [Ignavibacteria bacterium]|nr:hypothetical protein [Ignavibacteria bacterium]